MTGRDERVILGGNCFVPFNSSKLCSPVSKMAQRVKALAAEAYNLSSIHQVHMVEGDTEITDLCRLSSGLHMRIALWSVHMQAGMYAYINIYIYIVTNFGLLGLNPLLLLLSGGSF